MKLKDLTKEELENMSYDDVAFLILSEGKGKMKIIDLFKNIGDLVSLSDNEIEDKIADFFEMLTLDKRFIMLDDGSWDLKERHIQNNIIIEEDEDDAIEMELEEMEEEIIEEEDEDDIFYDEDDDTDDDLKDLVVIDEEEDNL